MCQNKYEIVQRIIFTHPNMFLTSMFRVRNVLIVEGFTNIDLNIALNPKRGFFYVAIRSYLVLLIKLLILEHRA